MVVIPFNKLATDTDAPVSALDNVLVDAPDETIESKILAFCREPKSVLESSS